MKYLILVCTVLLVTQTTFAQNTIEERSLFPLKPGLILNTAISSLLEPEGGPSLGLEYRISEKIAIGFDAARIFYTMPGTYNDRIGTSGTRIRPEIKYFFFRARDGYRHMYISLMGMHKKVEAKWRNTAVTPPGGVPEEDIVTANRTISALTANIGIQYYLDKKHHLILDLFVGPGIRRVRVAPEAVEYFEEKDIFLGAFNGVYGLDKDGYHFGAAFGCKLGYRF